MTTGDSTSPSGLKGNPGRTDAVGLTLRDLWDGERPLARATPQVRALGPRGPAPR